MPHSSRTRIAEIRSACTGEERQLAAKGLTHGAGLSLDHCEPAQEHFRALLALHLFNAGDLAGEQAQDAAQVTRYTFVVSPQHRDLRLVTDNPLHVARLLIRGVHTTTGLVGVPGMRLAGVARP